MDNDRKPGKSGKPGRRPAGPRKKDGRGPAAPKPPRPDGDAAPPAAPRRSRAAGAEFKVCGLNACLAVFESRPESIIRAYVSEDSLDEVGPMLRHLAESRRAYHVVEDAELERVSGSRHHEGVCILVKRQGSRTPEAFLDGLAKVRGPCCVLLLEGVSNPHNLGAILRVAAHFGVQGVLLAGTDQDKAGLSAAAFRTAEGGAEHVTVVDAGDGMDAIDALRQAGFRIVATSGSAPTSLYDGELPLRTMFLLGSEAEGLTRRLMKAADAVVAIPGTGAVESLNVACAASVLCAEFGRRYAAAPGRKTSGEAWYEKKRGKR